MEVKLSYLWFRWFFDETDITPKQLLRYANWAYKNKYKQPCNIKCCKGWKIYNDDMVRCPSLWNIHSHRVVEIPRYCRKAGYIDEIAYPISILWIEIAQLSPYQYADLVEGYKKEFMSK